MEELILYRTRARSRASLVDLSMLDLILQCIVSIRALFPVIFKRYAETGENSTISLDGWYESASSHIGASTVGLSSRVV